MDEKKPIWYNNPPRITNVDDLCKHVGTDNDKKNMNYNRQSLNLSEYIAKRKDEFEKSMSPDYLWYENLMWAMEDYYGSMGEFSEEDWQYIHENGLEEEAYYCENPD